MKKIKRKKKDFSILAIIFIVVFSVLIMSSAYALFNVRLAVNGVATISEESSCSSDLTGTLTYSRPAGWNNYETGAMITAFTFTLTNNSEHDILSWDMDFYGPSDMIVKSFDSSSFQANSDGHVFIDDLTWYSAIRPGGEANFQMTTESISDPMIIRNISVNGCVLIENASFYNDGTVQGGDVPDVELTNLAITPNSSQLVVGQSLNLSYTKTPSNASNSVNWSTTDTNIISIDSNGYVTALGVGTATVHLMSDNNIEATATINVVAQQDPSELTALSINPGSYSLKVGSTYYLSANKTPSTATGILTWSSSDTSIVTVDSNGMITGVSAGTATISLSSDNNLNATSTITVVDENTDPVVLTDFEIVPNSLRMTVGESATITISKTPSTANATFYYNSWNTDVATIDENGHITAVGNGTATINVRSDNNIQKQINVKVVSNIDPSLVSLSLSFTNCWGNTCQFELQIVNNNLSLFRNGLISFELPEGSSMNYWSGTYSDGVMTIGSDYSSFEPSQTYTVSGQINFPSGMDIEDAKNQVIYSFISGE